MHVTSPAPGVPLAWPTGLSSVALRHRDPIASALHPRTWQCLLVGYSIYPKHHIAHQEILPSPGMEDACNWIPIHAAVVDAVDADALCPLLPANTPNIVSQDAVAIAKSAIVSSQCHASWTFLACQHACQAETKLASLM